MRRPRGNHWWVRLGSAFACACGRSSAIIAGAGEPAFPSADLPAPLTDCFRALQDLLWIEFPDPAPIPLPPPVRPAASPIRFDPHWLRPAERCAAITKTWGVQCGNPKGEDGFCRVHSKTRSDTPTEDAKEDLRAIEIREPYTYEPQPAEMHDGARSGQWLAVPAGWSAEILRAEAADFDWFEMVGDDLRCTRIGHG